MNFILLLFFINLGRKSWDVKNYKKSV